MRLLFVGKYFISLLMIFSMGSQMYTSFKYIHMFNHIDDLKIPPNFSCSEELQDVDHPSLPPPSERIPLPQSPRWLVITRVLINQPVAQSASTSPQLDHFLHIAVAVHCPLSL